MTATEELCRMLDERGVEYEGGERSLRWRDRYGIMMQAFPLANGELGMEVWSCTPEQAVEATLGRGTCKYDFVPNIGNGFLNACGLKCSCCGREQMSMDAPKFCPNCGRKVVTNG